MKYFIIPIFIISLIVYLYQYIATKRRSKRSADREDAGVTTEKVSFGAIFGKLWDYVFWGVVGIIAVGAIILFIIYLVKYFAK